MGQHALTDLRVTFDADSCRWTIAATTGWYDGQPRARTVTAQVRLDRVPRAVTLRRGDVDVPTRPWQAKIRTTSTSPGSSTPSTCWVRVPQVSRDEAVSIQLTLGEGNRLIS